jgi:hypothetical protein
MTPPPQSKRRHRVAPGPGRYARVSISTSYRKANTFAELVSLVAAAEMKFQAAGIRSIPEQIKILRGIYYGTTWSNDYRVEKSDSRNAGFTAFTGSVGVPPQAHPILDQGLFEALQASQDVAEGPRSLDFGHVVIALDARASALARNMPFVGFGGTGLEIVTWLGDLGGGAAHLALARASSSAVTASVSFRGGDYGGSNNLEGDVAGYVIARGTSTSVCAPSIALPRSLSGALADYLSPRNPGVEWRNRALRFLQMNSATVDAIGTISDESAFISTMADKIATFAHRYLQSRSFDGRISETRFDGAMPYLTPAAKEVATTFVDALCDSIRSGGKIQATRFPAPLPAQAPGFFDQVEQWASQWL